MRETSEDLLCLVCTDSRIRARYQHREMECPLEREPRGGWTPASRDALKLELESLLAGTVPFAVRCTLPGRGILLRDWTLPPAPAAQKEGLIRLQLERSMPVDPEDLVWGSCPVVDPALPGRVRVLAMRRDRLQEWVDLLETIPGPKAFVPAPLLLLGNDSRTDTGILVLDTNGAEWLAPAGEQGFRLRWLDRGAVSSSDFIHRLKEELEPAHSGTAWIVGGDPELCRLWEGNTGAQARSGKDPLDLLCQVAPGKLPMLQWQEALAEPAVSSAPTWKRHLVRLPIPWVAAVIALLAGLFLTRYAAPLLHGDAVRDRMEALQGAETDFPSIDRELAFLKHVQTSQPPVLDLLAVVADAIPKGALVDSMTLDRRGHLNIQSTMPKHLQPTVIRTKLLESGIFSEIVIEEQTPIENNQKLKVRIQARFPAGKRISSPFLRDLDKKAKETKDEK